MLKEFFQKLKKTNKIDALNSMEELKAAATEFGYTNEQIDEMLTHIGGFPIDDDALEEIMGGVSTFANPKQYIFITWFSTEVCRSYQPEVFIKRSYGYYAQYMHDHS